MEKLTCKKCNGSLRQENNYFVCTRCGEIFYWSSNDKPANAEGETKTKGTSDKKSFTWLYWAVPLIIILLSVLCYGTVLFMDKNEKTEAVIGNTLKIGYTWHHQVSYFEDGELIGFDVDLAKEICKNLGMTPEFIEIDWAEKESLLESGEIDCVWSGLIKTEERINSMELTDVYFVNEGNDGDESYADEWVVGFKKGSDLADIINEELLKAKENGLIDELAFKYDLSTD